MVASITNSTIDMKIAEFHLRLSDGVIHRPGSRGKDGLPKLLMTMEHKWVFVPEKTPKNIGYAIARAEKSTARIFRSKTFQGGVLIFMYRQKDKE